MRLSLGVQLSHKKLEVLRSIDKKGISASENQRGMSASCESGNENAEVCSANMFKNNKSEAATEICGKWKRNFSKKYYKWWDDEEKDTVEKKKKTC